MPQLKDIFTRFMLISLASLLATALVPTIALSAPSEDDPANADAAVSEEPSDPEPEEEPVPITVLETLPLETLPFRIDVQAQEQAAVEAVRAALESVIAPEDLAELDGRDDFDNLFTDLRLLNYPTSFSAVEEKGFDVPFELTFHPFLEERYSLEDEAKTIHVDSIQERKRPIGLRFNGTDGSGWLAEDVTATYVGHQLAPTLDAAFAPTLPLNSAEGIYENVALYVQDDETKVVSKAVGLTYKVDKTAPQLTAFAIDGDHREQDDTWFFAGAARVAVSVKDPDLQTPAVSGLSRTDAWLEYEDQNGAHQAKGINISGLNQETGLLQAILDEDREVRASSFKVHVKDQAGNVFSADMAGVREIPASILRLVTDAAAPRLSVAFDNNDVRHGSYYAAARTGTFTVTEANFRFIQEYDPNQIIVSIQEDGQTHVFRAKDFQAAGSQSWQATYAFLRDADYTVEAQVVDMAGRTSERYAERFTIDATAPTLDVSFADEAAPLGIYYSAPRTATVTVTEHDFSEDLIKLDLHSEADALGALTAATASSWDSDGDVHRCTIAFPGPGAYTLAISGTDYASNPVPDYVCPAFVVDTEKPSLAISVNGEEDAASQAYRDSCAVRVVVTDANVDAATSVTVAPIGLSASANPYLPQTVISETQLSYEFPNPSAVLENDNVYRLEATATDRAGNQETRTVTWSVNRFGSTYVLGDETRALIGQGYVRSADLQDVCIQELNPSGIDEDAVLVSLTHGTRSVTLTEGQEYTLRTKEDHGWQRCEYVVSKDCFASDGLYQLSLRSADAAGNASMNIMADKAADVIFTVDDTPPIISLKDDTRFSVEDNTKVQSVTASVNGHEAALSDDGGTWSLLLSEDELQHAITLKATDAAGNTTTKSIAPLPNTGTATSYEFAAPLLIAAALAIVFLRRRARPPD